MPAIYPSTAFKTQQREIKGIADHEIVHITENGWGKYVFTSEGILKKTVDQAVENALYEKRLVDALTESISGFAEGCAYSSREEMMATVAKKREAMHV